MTLSGVAGIVLAGGRSLRFGSDKLAHPIDGEPLLWRPIRALAGAGCEELIIVIGPDGPVPNLPPELVGVARFARDTEPFGGPLAGLTTGLRAATLDRAIVVAGDQPSLRPELIELLAGPAGVRSWTADARLLVDPDGVVRPLPCALRRDVALAVAEDLLADNVRRLRTLFERLTVETIPETTWRAVDPDAGWTRDVDLPGDVAGLD